MDKKYDTSFTKKIYYRDDFPDVPFTFARLCESYGVKYAAVWSRCRKGMPIDEAIQDCINTPSCWGLSYVAKQNEHLI